MKIVVRAALALAAALALTGCHKSDDAAFDNRVHAYLMAHPEVIREAADKLRDKDQAALAKASTDALSKYRQKLERDPRDFVANPGGKITVVEFFDYRCGYCKLAAPQVVQLIKEHPDVRFVFKEFPIFGAASDRAAAGALLVKKEGGDYLGLYHDFMAQKGMDDDGVDQILKAHGVDPDQLSQPPVANAVSAHLEAVRKLGVALGVQGTPTFIVGDVVIPGEAPDALRAAVAAAKKG